MSLAHGNARRIARDLISKIAADWTDTSASRCIKIDDHHVFEFVIDSIGYAPLSGTDSVVRFNPLLEATTIVLDVLKKVSAATTMDAAMRDYVVRRDGKAEIHQMLVLAPQVFRDAIWQTRLLAGTVNRAEVLKTFGRPDLARGVINSALDSIRDRVKKRLPRVANTRNPKINQFTISKALRTFLPKFKQTRELPSQRQFAKAIGVTPKAWRTFLTNHDLDKHEITIKEWYEFMLAKESDPSKGGDFPLHT